MIARVHPPGVNVVGLLKYLYGPGRHEEHRDPRLVTAWNGAGARDLLEPERTARGGWRVKELADALLDPVRFSDRAPDRPVWHCSVRLAPEDRTLSDAQWRHIAGELMAQAGLAPHADDGSVRWVAVRHGDDHIHLVATLARQDGRSIRNFRDLYRLRAACRDLERRYRLRSTAPADRTAHSRPGTAELHKTRRLGRPLTARDQLRRRVRAAAVESADVEDFFAHLRRAGLLVRLRYSAQDPSAITGYAVALPGDRTADDTPVFYGGGRLAPDLSLSRLRQRWTSPPSTRFPPRVDPQLRAWILDQISLTIQDALTPRPRAGVDARIAFAAAATDVITVLAERLPIRDRDDVRDAADTLHRAVAEPLPPTRRPVPHADGLRAMGRLIAVMEQISDHTDLFAVLRLLNNLARLSESLADVRDAQQRTHQAEVARHAANQFRDIVTSSRLHAAEAPPLTRPASRPLSPTPDPRRRRGDIGSGPRP
ncbi:relaxase/mobilization nuclease domain-containing protein [Cryptosporangium aurantiacum]|uniref:Relaxase/Mobilisation nuclease domain-containing protein n=1 Tax=Cryptosporangium aurantiacum TaxID=134849 RepID=A0A1M7PQP0_9ACTN|nr:relaxase/mobilization nuclease domain-containing protein [Cryptosporangium aurantiacum]SHN19751.1 Relaxase/Mobilisation nuclease domain-containing protein [Cryptosporangium aurantiacum]